MVDLDNIICAYEHELIHWIKEHYLELGYDEIVEINSQTFPDFVMLRHGKKIRVEAELFSSSFLKHGHDPDKVDEVLCVIKDKELPVKTIKIEQLRMWFELEPDEMVDFFKEMPDALLLQPRSGEIIHHIQDDWVNLTPEREEKIRKNLREDWLIRYMLKRNK